MDPNWQSWFHKQAEIAERKGLTRVPEVTRASSVAAEGNIKNLVNLASNDYLGLSNNPDIASAAASAVSYGSGTAAARLAGGTHRIHLELENALAEFHRKEACMIFSSGYLANLGALSALVGKDDAIVSDKLNHASIIDGSLLSKARHYRYRHLDMEDLEMKLKAACKEHQKVLLVSEAIFSMNGDIPPLREIVELKNKYGALLYLDEAHSIGVRGTYGDGLAAEIGIADQVDIILATFGKAYGTFGSYLVADQAIISHLINTCRTFIFSTSLPVYNTVAAMKSLEIVKESSHLRENLARISKYLRESLLSYGIDIMGSCSQIVPVILKDNAVTTQAKKYLADQGILVNAIRPPTVPVGTSRLRLSLSAKYSEADMEVTAKAIKALLFAQKIENGS